MNQSLRILVTGAGGDVGQAVLKCLSNTKYNIKLYATCISSFSPWLHLVENSFVVPYSSSPEYIPVLISLINQNSIDVLIPTVDSEIPLLSYYKEHIESQTKCNVMVGNSSKIRIADDKLLTAEYLRQNGFPYPLSSSTEAKATFELLDAVGFPIVLKKRCGRGATSVQLLHSIDDLHPFLENPSFMFQQWMDPQYGEFTSAVYIGDDSQIKGSCTFKRTLRNGSTFTAQRIVDRALEDPIERIALSVGLKYINIQSMLFNGRLVPFEFNCRFSGTTYFASRIFNGPLMYVEERLLGKHLERACSSEKFVALRYYEEIFLDYASLNSVPILHP